MRTKAEKAAAAKKRVQRYQKAYHAKRYMEMKRNPLLSPEEEVEQHYGQFVLFMQDCLLPSTQYWTKFSAIFSTYVKYCKAIGQKQDLSRIQFAKVLANHMIKKMRTNGSYYSCLLKSKIFIKTEDVVDEPEFILGGSLNEEGRGEDDGMPD